MMTDVHIACYLNLQIPGHPAKLWYDLQFHHLTSTKTKRAAFSATGMVDDGVPYFSTGLKNGY